MSAEQGSGRHMYEPMRGALETADDRDLIRRIGERDREHHRAPNELADWSGLSQSEIATRLNVPPGTVKTRTRSALNRLAELLDDELHYVPTQRREIS